ncbi:MAG: hypothetical protein AM1032_000048 [Mycoplasmataceae bacterium]|nr:MAG: hypothetical protein AM1032_000048 [Mycoplasmataceae bacterium]
MSKILKNKDKELIKDLKGKFSSWKFNVYFFSLVYVFIFILYKIFLNNKDFVVEVSKFCETNKKMTSIAAGTLLGILFISDSIIASYLKTPLQRFSTKVEISNIKEEDKKFLLKSAQEANELFKETFKKFGILVIPSFIIKVVDAKSSEVLVWIKKELSKVSESTFFYICYVIPIIYASYIIWKMSKKLNKISKEFDFLSINS